MDSRFKGIPIPDGPGLTRPAIDSPLHRSWDMPVMGQARQRHASHPQAGDSAAIRQDQFLRQQAVIDGMHVRAQADADGIFEPEAPEPHTINAAKRSDGGFGGIG